MKSPTDKELLAELKRRIASVLRGANSFTIRSSPYTDGNHVLHFTIKNRNYLIRGVAVKKIDAQVFKRIH